MIKTNHPKMWVLSTFGHLVCIYRQLWNVVQMILKDYLPSFLQEHFRIQLASHISFKAADLFQVRGSGQGIKWTTGPMIQRFLCTELQVFEGQNKRKGGWFKSQDSIQVSCHEINQKYSQLSQLLSEMSKAGTLLDFSLPPLFESAQKNNGPTTSFI